MGGWTTPYSWNVGDTVPASTLNTYLRDDLLYFMAATPVASAATVTLDYEFTEITGVTTIDNIASNNPLVAGMQRRLFVSGGPITIRNNGGGTGNIRSILGGDLIVNPDEIILFTYDGTVWREESPT